MKKTPASLWQLLCAAMLLCIVLLFGAAVLFGAEEEPAPAESISVPAQSAVEPPAPAEEAPSIHPEPDSVSVTIGQSIRPDIMILPEDAESGKAESGEAESGKAESGKAESGNAEGGKAESEEAESREAESGKAENGKAESGETESGKTESGEAESGNAESREAESGKAARELVWQSDDPAIATVDESGRIMGVGEGACTVTVAFADDPSISAEIPVEVTPHEDLTYIDGILIANKTFSLPADYNPGVDEEANSALNEMIAGARQDGIALWVVSGFRSYNTQAAIYSNYVARDGAAAADRYSARAGYSEHQTGLAFDLNSLEQYFGATPEGQWLAAHCWEYGFIIRYQEDKEEITGYMYEPWHVRYLGKETAQKVYESGLCLEEYLGITSVYAE